MNDLDVLPVLPMHDQPNRLHSDAIASCQRGLRRLARCVRPTNLNNIVPGQVGAGMIFTVDLRGSRTTLPHSHIRHVLGLGAKHHIPRIDVSGRVVVVAYHQSGRDSFAEDFVCGTVGPNQASTKPKVSVAVVVKEPAPQPHGSSGRGIADHPVAERVLQAQTVLAASSNGRPGLGIAVSPPPLVMTLAPAAYVDDLPVTSGYGTDNIGHVDSLGRPRPGTVSAVAGVSHHSISGGH